MRNSPDQITCTQKCGTPEMSRTITPPPGYVNLQTKNPRIPNDTYAMALTTMAMDPAGESKASQKRRQAAPVGNQKMFPGGGLVHMAGAGCRSLPKGRLGGRARLLIQNRGS